MLAVLKIVVSVLMSRGTGNEQMKALIKEFLTENRASVVGVFKRNARIGGYTTKKMNSGSGEGDEVAAAAAAVLSELVDMYSLLISATGWLEVSLFRSVPVPPSTSDNQTTWGQKKLTDSSQHEDLSSSQSQRARLSVFS
jgi:nuclear pore complex protein Nup205